MEVLVRLVMIIDRKITAVIGYKILSCEHELALRTGLQQHLLGGGGGFFGSLGPRAMRHCCGVCNQVALLSFRKHTLSFSRAFYTL